MTIKSRADREAIDVVLDASELSPSTTIGTLRFSKSRTDQLPSFEYHADWLAERSAFSIDPRLELYPGEQHPHSTAPTFGILQDASPDRWGRVLMERRDGFFAGRQ